MPRQNETFEQDPKRFAGLTTRRRNRGLPTGRILTETPIRDGQGPLEWWEMIELQTAREVAAYRGAK